MFFKVSTSTHNHAVQLQHAIQAAIPCPGEVLVRQAALRLGQHLLTKGAGTLPDIQHVRYKTSREGGDIGLFSVYSTSPQSFKTKCPSGPLSETFLIDRRVKLLVNIPIIMEHNSV